RDENVRCPARKLLLDGFSEVEPKRLELLHGLDLCSLDLIQRHSGTASDCSGDLRRDHRGYAVEVALAQSGLEALDGSGQGCRLLGGERARPRCWSRKGKRRHHRDRQVPSPMPGWSVAPNSHFFGSRFLYMPSMRWVTRKPPKMFTEAMV